MPRWSCVAGAVLVIAAVIGCKPYQRQRRPRANVPMQEVAKDDESLRPPPPPPRPVEAPRPPPKPAPAPDRSTCGPGKGPRFDVHGVDPSDVLNVRVAPDAKSEVLGQLLPSTDGVLGLGPEQKVGPSTWRKVRCGELVGWVNDRFLDLRENGKTAVHRM